MSQAADSAGIPFEGRAFSDNPFQGDDGSCPVALARALDSLRPGPSGISDDDLAAAAAGLVDVLRSARVLVPLIAEAGETGLTPEGRRVDKTQELSVVTVAGPLGNPVGVMFSAVDQMANWRADARPIPVEATRVAAWALAENIAQVVLDPGGASVVVRQGMLWSLVSDADYVAPWQATDIAEVIQARALWEEIPALIRVSVHPGWLEDDGAGPDIIARVVIRPGLDRTGVDQITHALAEHWANHPQTLSLVDGMRVQLVAGH